MSPEEWSAAACKGQLDLFFSDDHTEQTQAKRICAGCPVLDECKAAALADRESFGVRGGMTARERWRTAHGKQPVVPRGRKPKPKATYKLRVVK